LIDARRDFFEDCLKETDMKEKPSIEFLKWSKSLRKSLDKYAEEYVTCLQNANEQTRSEILALDYKDIPFGPDEVGLVIFVRVTKLTNRTLWVKVLTPSGVGVCFADELEEVPLY
jgi:hypothetical protein